MLGGVVRLGLLGLLGFWLLGDGGEAGGPILLRFESADQCRACHEDVWKEWHGSHHQIAYLNPEVRKLSDDFRNKECQACHLPRPISITGYDQRTLPRQTHPDEGVSCLTCHQGAQGEILGRQARPQAPCAPVASSELVAVALCASCHNQHQTTDQWRASPQAAKGTSCNDCHMPEVSRTGRKGRRHVYEGAHDAAVLRQAGRFECRIDGGELVLSLENTGAGHNFPTEERHRAVDIVYRFLTEAGGSADWQRAFRFRQPYLSEPGENTQLPAGQKKVVRVAVPAGTRRVEARLWYRLTPYVGDDDPKSTLLAEQGLDLQ
jgi:hypothetical protein